MHQFNESERLKALKNYEISDSGIDNELQEITELAALICHTPFALITLKDSEKHWVKSGTDKELSINFYQNIFCKYALRSRGSICEISNVAEDERFKNNLSVKNDPSIKFCVSVPLINSKKKLLGNLGLMDVKPGKLTAAQLKGLKILGKSIVKQIELYTDLKSQKQENKMNYQRLYEITSQTPDFIFTLDQHLNITYINHHISEPEGSLLNKNVEIFILPADREEYKKTCYESLKEEKIIEKDFAIQTRNGMKCYSVRFCPLYNQNKKANSLLMIARDISFEKESKDELMKQQKILSEAQKISQTGSCEWDLKSGAAKFSNELYNILGIQKTNGVNHIFDLNRLIHPDDMKRVEELTVKAIKTFSSLLFQYRIITSKGELKFIDGRGCPLVVRDKKVISVLITLQDITESVNFDKKLFKAVVESEEKERARMAGELHDGVCQYLAGAKLMISTIGKALKPATKELNVEAIADMVKYTETSITDALDLTQQISHNLLPVEFHKKGVVQSVREMTERLNAIEKIHYEFTNRGKDTTLNPDVSINIFRIIQEFIRNSQKYSKATQVDISVVINKKQVTLEIKDNGIGFDLESVQKKKGVGLLSMRKRIQSIGGTFTYETAPGKGVNLRLKMIKE